jgi:hypothetical protein
MIRNHLNHFPVSAIAFATVSFVALMPQLAWSQVKDTSVVAESALISKSDSSSPVLSIIPPPTTTQVLVVKPVQQVSILNKIWNAFTPVANTVDLNAAASQQPAAAPESSRVIASVPTASTAQTSTSTSASANVSNKTDDSSKAKERDEEKVLPPAALSPSSGSPIRTTLKRAHAGIGH